MKAPPLHAAAAQGYNEVVGLLLTHGAEVNAATSTRWSNGRTALHSAAGNGYVTTVELLIEHGANVAATTDEGYTALHFAAQLGSCDVAELLLARGADVNAIVTSNWDYGQTPLHEAASRGHAAMVELLLAAGADAGALNSETRTALDYAFDFAFADVVELLGGDVADPNLGQWAPYTVIVEDQQKIRRFLRFEGIEYDEAWIPKPADIEGLDEILQARLEQNMGPGMWASSSVRANLRRYDREYGGFLEDGSRYIICNMIFFGGLEGSAFIPGYDAPGSDFTIVYDGGCGAVRVVFDVEKKTVVMIQCNGWA